MPEIAKSDPFWLKEDPHRTAYTEQTLLGPTMPIYEAFNPAIAQVNAEHVFSVAMFDVMNEGMAPEAGDRQGVQAGRGDLRKIPDRAGLKATIRRCPGAWVFVPGPLCRRSIDGYLWAAA